MHLGKFVIIRATQIAVTFFIILTLLFVLFRVAPGDPASMLVDPQMTPEDVEEIRALFGLDKPLYEQYLIYLRNFFQGEFGSSFYYAKPVINIIGEKLPNTILLFTTSIILSALAGISWGKVIAWKRGSFLDSSVTMVGLVSHTLFLPWIALLMVWVFAYWMNWFPLTGMVTPELWLNPETGILRKALDVIHHMVLPLSVLFTIHFGGFMLIMRSSMLETLKEDYIVTARAKGLTEREIRERHAAKNAALPVVTSVGLSLAFSINGGAITETIFSWPGIGRELVFAVSNNDYPLAQIAFLLIAGLVLVANLVVDILYAYLDPRIKY
jgi:peptide/nickel transport system permease protein